MITDSCFPNARGVMGDRNYEFSGDEVYEKYCINRYARSRKSTIGVVLAKILGYQFMDSDLLIQKQEGKVLHELISLYGIEGFIAIENQVNRDIHVQDHVIATGGSVVYGSEAMEALGKDGLIVYIQLSYETLKKRLGDLNKRGCGDPQGQQPAGSVS